MSNRTLAAALAAGGLALSLTAPAHATARWTPEFTAQVGGWNIAQHPRITADVNGDGLDDVIGFGHHGVLVGLSSGLGFSPAEGWLWGNLGFAAGGWNPANYHRTAGDVNGDGRADLIGFGHYGTFVALSTGEGFTPIAMWIGDYGYHQGWRPLLHDRAVGDVDGDGRADIVGFGNSAVLVARSTGAGFLGQQVWSRQMTARDGYRSTHHLRTLGDVDGDGRADVVSFHHGGVSVMRSTGARFEPAYLALADMGFAQRGLIADAPRAVADVDGDGRADVITMTAAGVLVARSNGRTFDPPRLLLDSFGAHTGWAAHHARGMGDVDGDGRADLVGFADDAVRVALSVGDGFDNGFDVMTGGDYATRFTGFLDGRCLSTDGAVPTERACGGAAPLGWILRSRPDGTHDIAQDGECLHRGAADALAADAAACGTPAAAWFIERDREGLVRLRSAHDGRCLRAEGDGRAARAVTCDASDRLLWKAETLRPQTMVTSLRAGHSGKCLSSTLFGTSQRACDGAPGRTFTLTDDGHGALTVRSHHSGLCLTAVQPERGGSVLALPCQPGLTGQQFALRALGGGARLLVSKFNGQCVDVDAGRHEDGTRVLTWDCHGGPNQQWFMPEVQSTAPMTFSLQNVGGAAGTALVIANSTGGFVTRDPVALVAFARRTGLIAGQETFDALLSVPQQAEFAARVGAWDAPLPDEIAVGAEVVSISADYDVGLDGADLGLDAALAAGHLEIGGVVGAEARVLSAEARITVRRDGVAFGPAVDVVAGEAGFGDPDGSYAGIGGGLGSRGFSVAARWGQDGQYGVTVPLGVVAVDLYVAGDDVITAAAFAADVGGWVGGATVDAFESAWGWSAGAFNSAVDAISGFAGDVGELFEDVGGAIADGFCGLFGC